MSVFDHLRVVHDQGFDKHQ